MCTIHHIPSQKYVKLYFCAFYFITFIHVLHILVPFERITEEPHD